MLLPQDQLEAHSRAEAMVGCGDTEIAGPMEAAYFHLRCRKHVAFVFAPFNEASAHARSDHAGRSGRAGLSQRVQGR